MKLVLNKVFFRSVSIYLKLLIGLIVLIILLFEAKTQGDFEIYLQASKDVLLGKNIYQTLYQQWFHYYYDVFFALILVPFNFLPIYNAKLLWLIINVWFIYRIWNIISEAIPLNQLSSKAKNIFIFLSFLFIFRYVRDNIHLAQITIFILYLTLEGLSLIHKDKKITGSALIALGINIKLLPLVVIPYLIYRRRWDSAIYISLFLFILLFLPGLFIGFEYNSFLLGERWHLLNPSNSIHILDTSERSFHSLTTLLATLFVKDCGDWHALDIKRNIADISISQLQIIISFVQGIFLLITLYIIRTKPFTKTKDTFRILYEISYLCLIIPLIFPHQQHYAFLFMFPASTYLIFFFIKKFDNESNIKLKSNKKIFWVSLYLFLFFITSSHFILGEYSAYYDHFKTLTYGVLIIWGLLIVNRPEKLNLYKKENFN